MTEILHPECAGELLLDFRNVLCTFAGNENVVDPDGNDNAKFGIDIEAGVCIESFEADFDKVFVKLNISHARGLL